jgi:hypothetical protein
MSRSFLYDNLHDKKTTGKVVHSLLQSTDTIHDSVEKATSNKEWQDSNVSCSTSQTTEHQFKFNQGILSDWCLEIRTDNSAAWDIGAYAMGTAIEEYTLENGGKELLKITGDRLFEYLWIFNTYYGGDTKVLLKNLMDNGGGDVHATSLFCPLLLPGQHGILGEVNQPINIGLSNDAFTIKIKIRAGDKISKTNALVITKVRLHYRSWQVEESLRSQFHSFSMVDFNWHTYIETVTQNTEKIMEVRQAFDQSSKKEVIGMFVRLVTNADVNTEFERFIGQQIEDLRLKVENKDVYKHETTQEAKLNILEELAMSPYDGTTYQYFIPFSRGDIEEKYKNKLHGGVTMSKVYPMVHITSSTATGTHYIFVSSMNKCTYSIRNGVGDIIY